jgi:methylisocitrate lyase
VHRGAPHCLSVRCVDTDLGCQANGDMTVARAGLRRLLLEERPLVVPGASDALSAKLIERSGFRALYMSGAAVSAVAGLPDLEMMTRTEMASAARSICSSVSIPVIADADTGFGNELAVMRTVAEYEHAGVAAVQIEDQTSPKRCGHLSGKECIPMSHMVAKIRAAVSVRQDPDTLVIARTDARQPEGFDEAVRRGRAYLDAGADLLFPEALESREEFAEFARAVKGQLVANMTEFGVSPPLSAAELGALGYAAVLFPVSVLRVALFAMRAFLDDLRRGGSQSGWLEQMMTRHELYDILDYQSYVERGASFAPGGPPRR